MPWICKDYWHGAELVFENKPSSELCDQTFIWSAEGWSIELPEGSFRKMFNVSMGSTDEPIEVTLSRGHSMPDGKDE